MTRTKVLLAWSALLLGLSACDKTTDSAGKDTAPANITANLSSTELTAGGASVDVSVAASSDTGLVSIDYSVKDASGNLATNSFLPQFVSMPKIGDKTFASSGWKFSALSTAKAGSYVLVLNLVEKSGKTSKKEIAFTVKPESGSDPVDPDPDTDPLYGEPLFRIGTLNAGAQGSAFGSFIELSGSDAGTLYTAGAGLPYRTIDVVFGVDGSTLSFMSPYRAKGGAFNLSSWSTVNSTDLVDMGTTKPASTLEIAKALDAGSTQTVPVVAGHYYGVGTTSGDLVLLQVTSIDGSGRTASADIDVFLVDGVGPVDPVDPIPTDWPKLDLGAQNAVPPSALDVDGMTAYSSGSKTASEIAEIDLLLYYMEGELRLVSPAFAKFNDISLVDGWTQTNSTYFFDNGTSPITTLSQAVGILDDEIIEPSVKVIAGHYYLLEQADGLLSVVKVESVSGTGSSSVVKVSMTTLGSSPFSD